MCKISEASLVSSFTCSILWFLADSLMLIIFKFVLGKKRGSGTYVKLRFCTFICCLATKHSFFYMFCFEGFGGFTDADHFEVCFG